MLTLTLLYTAKYPYIGVVNDRNYSFGFGFGRNQGSFGFGRTNLASVAETETQKLASWQAFYANFELFNKLSILIMYVF